MLSGSPPQVRGKLDNGLAASYGVRITPAGAGKTRRRRREISCKRDHPRRCGENVDTGIEKLEIAGSPPQVRGKRRLTKRFENTLRITPAGAGKTVAWARKIRAS